MHEHLEIVMPPTDDVTAAVATVMAKFDENSADRGYAKHGFWDWYVIGGRFAGSKFEATLDKEKLEKFQKELTDRKVTVSGLQFGKQALQPATQIPAIDALWNEYFPESKGGPCPLFAHSNDQYKKDGQELPADVMRFSEVPESLECYRVIFADIDSWDSEITAKEMFAKHLYNGCTFQATEYKGTFGHAVELYLGKIENYRNDYRESSTPKDDWLVVTVDYHT